MNLADRLTSSRLFLAPIFFIAYQWGSALGQGPATALLWVLFVAMEISDLLDGKAARKQGTVSAFGKLFDPFADVIERMTYFVCFAFSGIMPIWALLLILYREFAQLFLRMVLSGRGIAMGARPGGKLKAVFLYAGRRLFAPAGQLRAPRSRGARPPRDANCRVHPVRPRGRARSGFLRRLLPAIPQADR